MDEERHVQFSIWISMKNFPPKIVYEVARKIRRIFKDIKLRDFKFNHRIRDSRKDDRQCLALYHSPLSASPSLSLARLRSSGSKGQGTGSGAGFLRYFHTWLGNYLFTYTGPSIYSSQTSRQTRAPPRISIISRATFRFGLTRRPSFDAVYNRPLSPNRGDWKNCVEIISGASNWEMLTGLMAYWRARHRTVHAVVCTASSASAYDARQILLSNNRNSDPSLLSSYCVHHSIKVISR